LISVILSGRPLLIGDVLQASDALIEAWLPGTSGGQGIIDAISGEYIIRPSSSNKNTLSMDWPRDMVKYLFILVKFV
jgi:beta-glucosidase